MTDSTRGRRLPIMLLDAILIGHGALFVALVIVTAFATLVP